ncbi:MAG: YciI family protein [Steroidobacteraceae bacterium]|jgi:hypothetical protein
MKVMVMVKATALSEAGAPPSEATLTAMEQFNGELIKAGVLLAAEGLHPSVKGKRVHYKGEQRTVVDGPFAETKELVAGFWLWQVKSIEEAMEWLKRCPNPGPGEWVIEARPVFEPADFGAALTPALRATQETRRSKLKGPGKH